METLIHKKYKVDLEKINEEAVEAAFGESRCKVNEEGLPPRALEAKKSAIAIQETAKLFHRAALEYLKTVKDRITAQDREDVYQIASNAIAEGDGCLDYLRRFCEGEKYE